MGTPTPPSAERPKAQIYVLAGPNGAGKSSVGGPALAVSGGRHFDPDQTARELHQRHPDWDREQADSEAWHQMVRLLRRAITEGSTFAFETTLRGTTIPSILAEASAAGSHVRVWYVALASADLHVDRAERRQAVGGDHIPEEVIRLGYDASREHLVDLLPLLEELYVYDNTEEKPAEVRVAEPRLLLHMQSGKVSETCPLEEVPHWAKSIMFAAAQVDGGYFAYPQA